MSKVICFGEVLWDVLPTERKPGGAPMNVAYHLRRLGIESYLISKIGEDFYGNELKLFLQQIGIPINYVQTDPVFKTSEVIATPSNSMEMSYEIVAPVAWDFVNYNKVCAKLVQEADMIVYGSLAVRNEVSRNTLYKLLENAPFKLFDVNFRAPHYTEETVSYLMSKADAVKLNEHELDAVATWIGSSNEKELDKVNRIQERFQLSEIIITKGGNGVSYYTLNERYDYPAYKVEVKDTVGSGDSFLAAFIAQKLAGKSVNDILDYATALGAFVTSQSGANPIYKLMDLNHFIWEKQLERLKWK